MSISVFLSNEGPPSLHTTEPQSSSSPTKVVLEYLSEGGANFVFRIVPETGDRALPDEYQKKLLRLRKDLSHVQSAREQLSAFNEYFKPLFPSDSLVQQSLIELDPSLPARLNANIRKLNRPSHRVHDFLPEKATQALLITDMTPEPGDILLQLKPKWLAQSPNAPPNARRCRTCALRALRASQRVRTATDAQESCPLELTSSDPADRKQFAQRITVDIRLQDYLVTQAQPLLHVLRENQVNLDSKGVLNTTSSEGTLDLCKAMTIRDCTLFLKRSGNDIEARLADLDLKQPEKLGKWKKAEQDLINLGWYDNSEAEEFWKEEKVCLLSC